MKADDDDEGVDDSSSDLDTIVNKVGAAMAEMRTTIVGIQSEKDELVRELDLSRSDNDDVVAELELWYEPRTRYCDGKFGNAILICYVTLYQP